LAAAQPAGKPGLPGGHRSPQGKRKLGKALPLDHGAPGTGIIHWWEAPGAQLSGERGRLHQHFRGRRVRPSGGTRINPGKPGGKGGSDVQPRKENKPPAAVSYTRLWGEKGPIGEKNAEKRREVQRGPH